MKKIVLAILVLGILSVSAFAQRTRPRVVPTPAPPVLQNESKSSRDKRPPVLGGNDSSVEQNEQAVIADEDEVIKVETNLVTMPVSVLDRDGRFIGGLQQKDFRIYENGIEQKLEYFQSVEQPFTVVLMLDVSPSTEYKIDEIQNAAISFVDQLRANDKVMVIAFDENVQILSRPTSNRNMLRNAIRQAQIGDGTSLYEAVDQVISGELQQIQGRKAVVLFTDGVDTTSKYANYQSTLKDVEETDALFYTIRYNTQPANYGGNGGGYGRGGKIGEIFGVILGGGNYPNSGGRNNRGNRSGSAGSSRSSYETGRQYLETLSANSGGRNFEADTLMNLEASFSGIAEELRRQYSLGYYPETVGKLGERKQIKIRVMRPNVVVRAKNNYVVGETDNRFAGR